MHKIGHRVFRKLNVKSFYSKTNYFLKIWSYFKALIHFQAILTYQMGSIFGSRTTFEALNTIQRPIEKYLRLQLYHQLMWGQYIN